MTMVRPGIRRSASSKGDVPTEDSGPHEPGTRQRRRLERQRVVREQILTLVVLAAALAVTLVLLGLQWLDSGGSSPAVHGGSAGALSPFFLSEVHP